MIEERKKKERVVLEFSCRAASVRFWKIQKIERKNKTWSDCQRNVSYIAHLPGIAKLCQKNILLCKMLLSFDFFSFFLKFTSNQIKKRFINSRLNLFIAQSFFGWNMHKKERKSHKSCIYHQSTKVPCNAGNMQYPGDISVTGRPWGELSPPTSDGQETERVCVAVIVVRLAHKLPRVLWEDLGNYQAVNKSVRLHLKHRVVKTDLAFFVYPDNFYGRGT